MVTKLVTNGIKHGGGHVWVSCKQTQDILRIEMKFSGLSLPKRFPMGQGRGFGLRAVKTMVEGPGGKVVAVSGELGILFEVALSMSAAQKR